ncbi:MAG: helix-turn-helix transcriptional regulator [Candidatus Nanopelagicaceae bacterium]
MASEKNSRLINLVIALLATKKFLTKPQIFKAVSGYEGSAEAADRMFERDKEELRSLGIAIEMKSIDPLFEDEIGYRIAPERYRLDLGKLTPEEVSILALAAEAWRESAIADVARSTALRLESLGIVADFEEFPIFSTALRTPTTLLDALEAIESARIINLDYLDSEDISETKRLAPHGIYSKSSNWYLFALDLESHQFKSYRFDRIDGEIKVTKKGFERVQVPLPEVHFPSSDAILEIRRDRVPELFAKAELLDDGDEWQRVKLTFESESIAKYLILKYTPDVKVLEPISLVSSITKSLSELALIHAN